MDDLLQGDLAPSLMDVDPDTFLLSVRDQPPESETGKLVDAALLGAARELLERIPKRVEKVVSGEDEPVK